MATGDNFDRVWARMSAADREVLLGHSNKYITAEEKVKLAALVRDKIRTDNTPVRKKAPARAR